MGWATAFAQQTEKAARAQWRSLAEQLRPSLPELSALMDAAEGDVLAGMSFPRDHGTKIHSVNPLEGLNGEIKRRTPRASCWRASLRNRMIRQLADHRRRHLPNEAAITRLVGAILLERSDEWVVQRARDMTLETLAPMADPPDVNLPKLEG